MLYLLILIIPLLLYAILAAIILFHLKKYAIDRASAQKIATAFIVISIILAAFTAAAFFSIPWNSLDTSDFIRNSSNVPSILMPP